MKKQLFGILIGMSLVSSAFAEVPLCEPNAPDQMVGSRGNLVASRLEGAWVADRAITQRLAKEQTDIGRMSFRKDLSVLQKLPDHGTCAVIAGTMTFDTDDMHESFEYPFTLETRRGSAIILYYRPVGPHGEFNSEWLYINLARAKDSASDILFVGEDTLEEGVTALVRN